MLTLDWAPDLGRMWTQSPKCQTQCCWKYSGQFACSLKQGLKFVLVSQLNKQMAS